MVWVNNGNAELDTHSEYRTILGVCIALPILTTIIVCLRAFARSRILKVVGIDDYIIFFSAICGIIYAGLCIGQSKWGLGLPIKLRPKPNLNEYSIVNFVGRPFYMMGILGFKVALCFAYLRIMKASTHRIYKAVTWTVMITCIIGHVAGTLILIFQCKPIRKSWLPLTKGTCLPNDATFYGLAAVTIFYDVIIFILPIPLLLRLNISNRKKFALVCVFLLGLLTTVCSILRMVQIITIAKTGNSTMLVLWGVIELNIGIILTCIPTLGPLFPYFRGSYTSDPYSPSKAGAYKLSGLRSANGHRTPHNAAYQASTHLSAAAPDLYGAAVAGTTLHSSSSDDMVPFKNQIGLANTTDGAETGPQDPRVDDIVKTTDIRVSVDDDDVEKNPRRAGAGHEAGPVSVPRKAAKAW